MMGRIQVPEHIFKADLKENEPILMLYILDTLGLSYKKSSF